MAEREFPSPASYLPRVRAFEFHDLDATPYVLRFLTTRALEVGWVTDFALVARLIAWLPAPLGPRVPPASLRPSDGIAELLVECADLLVARGALPARDKSSTGSSTGADVLRVLDICSGAGGPMFAAATKVASTFAARSAKSASAVTAGMQSVALTVSDIVPHPDHWAERVTSTLAEVKAAGAVGGRLSVGFEAQSVDATRVPPHVAPGALWTLCASFHHFDDDLARGILRSAVTNGECRGILIVELSEHRLLSMVFLCVLIAVLACFSPLFVLPLRRIPSSLGLYAQILLALPVFVFTAVWDTAVSCMRTLTTHEMLALAARADPDGVMEWHAAVRPLVADWPLAPGVVYLRGIKK